MNEKYGAIVAIILIALIALIPIVVNWIMPPVWGM